jgi:hypothetical protein
MQHIETVTVGSGGAASVTFSAIPDTYTDLLIVVSARSEIIYNGNYINFRFNGSSSGYTNRMLTGFGSGVNSNTNVTTSNFGGYLAESSYTADTFSSVQIYIPNYRSSVAKSSSSDGVSENNATEARQSINAGLWSGTDPVTSITFITESGDYAEGSTFYLYGITAGSDGITSVS